MGWLLPVGTPGGINSGFDGIPNGSGIVRLGGELGCLEPDDYRLWRAAFAAPQAEELIDWGAERGIAGAADRVRQLEDDGLLLAESPTVSERFGALALRLIGECLGNGEEVSPVFFIGGRSGTRLQVDGFVFEVLLGCDGLGTVGAMCDTLDAMRSEPGYRARLETLTRSLPILVRSEVVQLERAVRR